MVRKLEEQYGERMNFAYISYYEERNRLALAQYAVRGHPTIIVLDPGGGVASRFPGPFKPSALVQALDQVAGRS